MTEVILKGTRGELSGQQFALSGKGRLILGRSCGCCPRLPADDLSVSRFHCMLSVEPPSVWVEDLGSLNGTYVNGTLIGQRGHTNAEPSCLTQAPRRLLNDGDQLAIGTSTFSIDIYETHFEPEYSEEEGFAAEARRELSLV